jgi:hypothetical protein
MRYRHHYDGIAVQAVNQSVRKTSEQAAPESGFDLRTGQGIGNRPSDCPI